MIVIYHRPFNTPIIITPQNPAINYVQNSKLLGNIEIFCENEQADLKLAEQIYMRIRILSGCD